jgi:hypothetical protein
VFDENGQRELVNLCYVAIGDLVLEQVSGFLQQIHVLLACGELDAIAEGHKRRRGGRVDPRRRR